ncbi:MAG: hypothetical protein MI700_02035, partial [Balneolales bacterium]|nr:hypothetical protein [Balneolales bacterium]
VSISKYREMVEEKIAELTERSPILQKLKAGELITEDEANALAEELHEEEPHITENLLRKVYKHQKAKFIEFIKHILGIEILESFDEQVGKAVQKFIQEHTQLSTRQIEFLHLMRDYIIERGNIEKRDLIQAPFTIIHPKGVRGIFSPSEIKEIVTLTEKFAA